MSIAWLTKLYRLNDAGRFDAAIKASAGFLKKRPKDWALHLQRGKALVSVGQFDDARTHLDRAIELSKGLAAWPWFYRAALHARLGDRPSGLADLTRALRLDGKLAPHAAQSPFFVTWAKWRPFRALGLPKISDTARSPTSRSRTAGGSSGSPRRTPAARRTALRTARSRPATSRRTPGRRR
ncbi:MAG: tetratricopeptide repeat protein [Myxococcaceae bacterium]